MRPFFTTEEIILKCQESHGKKYDYSLVDYKGSRIKIKIKCNACFHVFDQLPYNHYGDKKGCPKCYNFRSRKIQQLSLNEFIKRSNKIHKNLYKYDLVNYINNRIKVKIKCNTCNTIFEQRPMHHLIGNGCRNCWNNSYQSKLELNFLDFLKIKDRQKNIGKCIVDGIDGNVIYEFLGDFWHGNLQKYDKNEINEVIGKTFFDLNKKTKNRFKYFSCMGYKIKYIWESDWKEFIKNKNGDLNLLDFDENLPL